MHEKENLSFHEKKLKEKESYYSLNKYKCRKIII